MPECVWLKARAGVSRNALLMGAAIRRPSPASQRKTRQKHAACQRLIRERGGAQTRNSKSLCSPRALSAGSPALLEALVIILHTPVTVCVCVCSTVVVAEAHFLSLSMFKGLQRSGVTNCKCDLYNDACTLACMRMLCFRGISALPLKAFQEEIVLPIRWY